MKPDSCSRLQTSKEWLPLKPRAADLAVVKMDGGLIGISGFCSSWQKSSLLCWDNVVLDPCLLHRDGAEGMGAEEKGQWGKREK